MAWVTIKAHFAHFVPSARPAVWQGKFWPLRLSPSEVLRYGGEGENPLHLASSRTQLGQMAGVRHWGVGTNQNILYTATPRSAKKNASNTTVLTVFRDFIMFVLPDVFHLSSDCFTLGRSKKYVS